MLTLALNLEPDGLLAVGAVMAAAVLGSLRVLATWVEQEQGIHDLKVRSHELRLNVARRMAQREGLLPYEEGGDVEVLAADDPRSIEFLQGSEVGAAEDGAPREKIAGEAPEGAQSGATQSPPDAQAA
jgi:hypothetical protein